LISNVTKRKHLRTLFEYYEFILRKYLNVEEANKISTNQKDYYIKLGYKLFESEGLRIKLTDILKELKIDPEPYIPIPQKTKEDNSNQNNNINNENITNNNNEENKLEDSLNKI
jgi:hypothetical protein